MTKSFLGPLLAVLVVAGCIEGTHDVTVRFDAILGLQKGDPVVFEESIIGQVEGIEMADGGRYGVEVAVDKAFASAITTASRFYIDAAPGRSGRKAVRMVQLEPGGDPLEEGAVVEGQTKFAVFSDRLAHQLGANLHLLEKEVDAFLEALRQFSESDEIEDLERQLGALIDDLGAMTVEMKRTLEDEVLPLLQKKLEELRRRLEKSGQEDRLDTLDDQMDVLSDRIRT